MNFPRSARILAAAVAVAGGLLLSGAAAQAAPLPASNSHAATAHAPALTLRVVNSESRAAANAAGDPCNTINTRVNGYETGILQWWVQLSTYYCWNGTIVTYHSTSLSHDQGSSWYFSPGPIIFNCFKNTSTQCSGNHEHNESSVSNGSTYVLTYVTIDQYEYQNGTWKWTWHTTTY